MADHNHTGSVWSKNQDGTALTVNRRKGPGTNFDLVEDHGTLDGGTPVIVLCYTMGEREISFDAPDGQRYKSHAWDFVVISDRDPGGYVADVLIDTGGPIDQQLGTQGTCSRLGQHLTNLPSSHPAGIG